MTMNLRRPPYICAQCTAQIASSPFRRSGRYLTPTLQRRLNSHTVQTSRPLRIAVIGSGPAGFYAAYRLLGKMDNALVDMYEKLPVPFGLSRYGVAPDHPEVKNCEDKFTEVATSPRFNFIGNVDLGVNLPMKALKPHYDAILFSYGASKDKELGIPGEGTMRNVYSAREFVGWYNGHPEHRDLAPDLTRGENAVIVGQGNVALDVARILLSDVDQLRKTDIADYALEELSKSKVKRVRVVGRRGPLQASFTTKEVREIIQLPNIDFEPIPSHLFPDDSTIKSLPRAQKRLIDLLSKGPAKNITNPSKSWSLDFLMSPESLVSHPDDPTCLSHVRFARNKLDPSDPHSPSAKIIPRTLVDGRREQVDVPAETFFRSVGYKSYPLPGLEDLGIQFDESRGVIPNDGFGRITTTEDTGYSKKLPGGSLISYLPGLYCAGWVKRGPTGVIATTMMDAFSTAEEMAADMLGANKDTLLNSPASGTGLGWEGVRPEAEKRGIQTTSWKDWQRLDAMELERGKEKGKIRDKVDRVEDMLKLMS